MNKERMIDGLREVYDNNRLTEQQEIVVLEAISFFGGEVFW
jgi:hypothetical protein